MNFYFIDLDGTIEDSRLDMAHCANAVRRQFQLLTKPIEELIPFVNKGMKELYLSCFSDLLSAYQGDAHSKKLSMIQHNYESYYLNNCCVHTKCYEGIEESLEFLSKKGKVIVVTNKPEKISRRLLNLLQLEDFITDVMGGDSCSECKPSALPLKIAAERHHKTSEDDCFMIGDSLGDIQAAKAFGAKAVWCAWGYSAEKPSYASPDITLLSPLGLQSL